MDRKVCAKCGEEKPITAEHFNKDKKRKDGLQPYCNVCRKEYRKENAAAIKDRGKRYYQENKTAIEARKREYNKKNATAVKRWKRDWYERNAADLSKSGKENYQRNKEAIKERARKYREKNADKIKEYRIKNADIFSNLHKQRLKENPGFREERKEICKKWREKSAEHIKSYREKPEVKEMRRLDNQKRRARERSLPATLTISQWRACKEHFNNACAYCGKESQKLQQEHFVPVVSDGNYTLNNIIPSCRRCNESKNDRDFFSWYPQQSFYSNRREAKILKYLNYVKPGEQQTSIFEIER